MKTKIIHNLTLPKISFGTARIDGLIAPIPWRDATHLSALRSALEVGYARIDTAELSGMGRSEILIRRAMRESGDRRLLNKVMVGGLLAAFPILKLDEAKAVLKAQLVMSS